jgi:hypothetical protein
MATQAIGTQSRKKMHLSVDGWAITVSLVLAILIRVGVLKHVPW